MSPTPDGDVLVGDIGDNLGNREAVTVTRVPMGEGQLTAPGTSYDLVFPDGAHDAESLLVHPRTGRVYIASKEFIGRLYAAPAQLSEDSPNPMQRLGEVMPVSTDGAFFPDGRHLVLRDYGQARVYTFPGLREVGEIDLPAQEQGEGIAVGEDGEVYVSSEGVNSEVLRIRLPERIRSAVEGTAPGGGTGAAGEADEAGDADATGTAPGADESPGADEEPGTGILLSPWIIGGVALVLIVVVLLRSLRPR